MSATIATAIKSPARPHKAERFLSFSIASWWAVTLIGQWAFLYYIAGFYGRTIVTGKIELWNRNHDLFKGYVAGDHAWNAYFGAHVMLAAVISFGGALQLLPWLRRHAIGFHRWNGRAFMVTALGCGITGLWMTWVRGVGISGNSRLGLAALSFDTLLIIAFAAIAWSRARRGEIQSHRRWALRLFMVANAVWFLRLDLFAWYLFTGGLWVTDNLDGPMNFVIDFGSYLLPLLLLEGCLRARDTTKVRKVAMAAVLLVSTVYMCVGIFALSMNEFPRVLQLGRL